MPRSATFAPLAHRTFALLMLGVLLTNLGSAIQSIGAAWQLTAQGEAADVVALVRDGDQPADHIPRHSPPAPGRDVHDRRRISSSSLQAGMLTLSFALAWLAVAGTSPPGW